MRVRLGTNPIAWSNDDMPELGGATPLETCLREAAEAGFTGIELGNKFPRAPGLLRAVLAEHDLALVSGWYGAELRKRSVAAELEAMRPHLDLLKALGCQVMVFCEVSDTVQNRRGVALRDRPLMSDAEWRLFIERLDELARLMEEEGVRLAYHHHMGTVVQQSAEIDHLMGATSRAVGLLYDTGHLAFAGEDPAEVARRWSSRIIHIHAKDVRPEVMARVDRDGLSFPDAVVEGVFTVPGDGAVDFEMALKPLAEARYTGWMVVEAEQDPAKAEPAAYARKGYAHLRATVEKLGFTVA